MKKEKIKPSSFFWKKRSKKTKIKNVAFLDKLQIFKKGNAHCAFPS